MRDYIRMGLTRGEFGKPGYLHALIMITEEQDKEIAPRIDARLQMTDEQDREIARRIETRLKDIGEEHITNDDHWGITMEVLRGTRKKE